MSIAGSGDAHLLLALLLSCILVGVTSVLVNFRRPRFWHPLQLAVILLFIELVFVPAAVYFGAPGIPGWTGGLAHQTHALGQALNVANLGTLSLLVGALVGLAGAHQPAKRTARLRPPNLRSWKFASQAGLALAVISLVLHLIVLDFGIWSAYTLTELFASRRLARAGTGWLAFFRVAAYLAVIIEAARPRADGRRGYLRLGLYCVLAGIPFLLMGRRGEVFYPFLLAFLARGVCRGYRTSVLRFVPVLAIAILLLGMATDVARRSVATGSLDQAIASVDLEPALVPRSFAHVELLASVQELDRSAVPLPPTLQASLLNWIPRQLMAKKPLTTGPTLTAKLSPEWFRGNQHLSSYTTGPIVEGFYHGRLVGVAAVLFALGWLMSIVARLLGRIPSSPLLAAILIYEAFILGWRVWVDDLGGAVNGQVSLVGAVLLVASTTVAIKGVRGTIAGRSHSKLEARRDRASN